MLDSLLYPNMLEVTLLEEKFTTIPLSLLLCIFVARYFILSEYACRRTRNYYR